MHCFNVLFSRLYGGLKVGYLKRIDVFYSMTIATICTNVITYFQITLINRWFLDVWPMVEMTLVQFTDHSDLDFGDPDIFIPDFIRHVTSGNLRDRDPGRSDTQDELP